MRYQFNKSWRDFASCLAGQACVTSREDQGRSSYDSVSILSARVYQGIEKWWK